MKYVDVEKLLEVIRCDLKDEIGELVNNCPEGVLFLNKLISTIMDFPNVELTIEGEQHG